MRAVYVTVAAVETEDSEDDEKEEVLPKRSRKTTQRYGWSPVR
jgi:hypothetical protein